MRTILCAAGAVLGLLVAAGAARADSIRIEFHGTVTGVSDAVGSLDGAVGIGTVISGWYSYESGSADLDGRSTVGSYSISSAQFWIGTRLVEATYSSDLSIFNDIPDFSYADRYAVTVREADSGGNEILEAVDFTLFDPIGSVFASDGLPLGPPDVSSFSGQRSGTWRLYSGTSVVSNVTFGVDELVLAPVPEPGTLALFGLGAAGLAWRRRSRKQ